VVQKSGAKVERRSGLIRCTSCARAPITICYDWRIANVIISPEGFMLSSIWDFLKDGSNQAVLSWIGGGIVVVAGGLWAALKYLFPKEKDKSAAPAVYADRGGFAAGRDIRNNTIDRRSRPKR
jgi:hypothetical protein